MLVNALIILAVYLVAAFPVLNLLARMRGYDISKEDDLHSALWHKVGRVEGFIGITWDIVKGGVAVAIMYLAGLGQVMMAAAGVAAVVGRLWSVFIGWKGEKGNTTSLGVHVALAWQAWPFLFGPIILGAGIRTIPRMLDSSQPLSERLRFGGPPSNSLPLGMLGGFALFPFGVWVTGQSLPALAAGIAIFILIVVKRVTADVRKDLRDAADKRSIIINRIFLDRSHFRVVPKAENHSLESTSV